MHPVLVRPRAWALVAPVLGAVALSAKVPKARARVPTAVAQLTVAACANPGCARRPWSRALKRSKHQETRLAL